MSERPRGRSDRVMVMAVAGALCAVYAIVRPPSQDFASGNFRATLFRDGIYWWNNFWYGGHPLPGYGIVSPLLGSVFGVIPVAVASVLVATWCFLLLTEGWRTTHPELPDPMLGSLLFAIGCSVSLWGGRMTFGPAVMFGTLCVLALQRRRPVAAIICAALCGLSSPVGALSLGIVMGGAFFARSADRRLLVAITCAAAGPIGILIVLFPEEGSYPFTFGGFTMLFLVVAATGWFGRAIPLVRWTAIVYGVVAVAAFVVPSPLGGNAVRLGWLMAAPTLALTVPRSRRLLLPAAVSVCLIWSFAYVKIAFLPSQRATNAEYFASLASYLNTVSTTDRVEVVPTPTFGEADEVALQTSGIARGWERQIDRASNPEFYDGQLDAATYHQWLHDNAIALVALPLAGVQDLAIDEAAVIRSEPPFLKLLWSNADWSVYRVVDATPLADNGATVTAVAPESLTIDASKTGVSLIKFRYTDLYSVSSGEACIEASPDGWINLDVRRPGLIELTIDASISALLTSPDPCA